MPDPYHQNAHDVILDVSHDAPGTDAVAPERGRVGSADVLEGRAETARIVQNAYAVAHEQSDASRDLPVEPAQIP